MSMLCHFSPMFKDDSWDTHTEQARAQIPESGIGSGCRRKRHRCHTVLVGTGRREGGTMRQEVSWWILMGAG